MVALIEGMRIAWAILEDESVNTRDVLMTAGVLITGIFVGYLLGRNSILTAPQATPASTGATTVSTATAVPTSVVAPVAAVADTPTPSPATAPSPKPQPVPSRAQARKVISPYSLADIPLMGDPSTAKVAITIFSDFQ